MDHSSDAVCPRHPTRPTAPGLNLCRGCVETARVDLAYLSLHWRHLNELHTAGTTGAGIRTIHADPPAPCRIDVLDHARDLATILGSWTRLVVEDRELSSSPTGAPAQAMWLTIHLDWLAASDFADEFADEVRDCRWTLAKVIGDVRTGQRVACPLDDCGTPIRVDIHDPEAVVTCRGCGVAWTAGRLLLHAVAGEAQAWADAEAITSVTGISRATLDRWARTGRISRRNGLFLLGEVMTYRRVGTLDLAKPC